jgi:hypothetical protein
MASTFQSVVPAKMGQGIISSGLVKLYTTPAATRSLLKDIDVSNQGASGVTVTVYVVPNGSTPGPGNVLIPGIALPANSILQWTGTQIMVTGDSIQAVASGGGPVSMTASGGEAT